MINVKSFPIDKFEEANKFINDNPFKISKEGLKFVGNTEPRIVIMYNEFEPGSREDILEGLEGTLGVLKQQLAQYEQQVEEHKGHATLFGPKDNRTREHQDMVDRTEVMIKVQKSKIATTERLITEATKESKGKK